MEQVTLEIQGMSCGHCVAAVKRALGDLAGVEVRDVQIGAAQVAFDPAVVSPEQIASAVEDEGYTVRGR